MEILEFLIGDEQFPVYRTVTPREADLLRTLLGASFHFELEEGGAMDELLFDVLANVAMRADVFFARPPDASVLGTFALRDASVSSTTRSAAARGSRRMRVH